MTNITALKTGYTTGSHAVSAFKSALISLLSDKTDFRTIEITMPDGEDAVFNLDSIDKSSDCIAVKVTKGYNDDIDVTKGCEIICKVSKTHFNIEIEHNSYEYTINDTVLKIWAGKGLGIVTKNGLQSPVGYPAINPVPLAMMKKEAQEVLLLYKNTDKTMIHVLFEVIDGEKLAKETANDKAGIVGGISFLGKTGFVKPVSNEAYLDSLKEEINVAAYNSSKRIVLTMGNSCLEFAHKYYDLDKECFLSIGNFIFDTLNLLKGKGFSKIIIVANIGKLTKIGQGKKNTNNRYGGIDFSILKSALEKFPDNLLSYSVTTVSALESIIIKDFTDYKNDFYSIIMDKAVNVLALWFNELNIDNCELEVILTNGDGKKLMQGNKKC